MSSLLPPAVAENAILFGGKHVTVTYRNRAPGLESCEKVFVPLLEISPRLAKYLDLALDESALAEWLCDRPAGWAASLMPESVMDLAETAHALNFTTARRWAEHRAKVADALVPLNQRLESVSTKVSPPAARAPV
jgi:hypothetical protein